ncbi:MAG TPA: lipase maturation factor family protein [Bryobacteraceae bacterium]|nr:lipase maturation factor family protein [Bryobacteraceae bacterium]
MISYRLTESTFLRVLGLVYLAAFASFWPQIDGLMGSHGIAPAVRALAQIHADLGGHAYFEVPTIFWFGIGDRWLVWICVLGCVASVPLIIGFFPRWAAIVCWVLYLSIISVGQPFTGFQWDALLLEAGFLAFFAGAPWLVWAYRVLLFRLMFESGAVKLLSGDPNWRNLHALRFHFLTQPLPTPLAYYVYRAPDWMLDGMTLVTLVIELGAPVLLFCPKYFRYAGIAALMFLQVCILLTGNYAFFNLLTLGLCLWALDDRIFAPIGRWLRPIAAIEGRTLRRAVHSVLVVVMVLGGLQVMQVFMPPVGRAFSGVFSLIAPWQIVNSYGLFAVMTTERLEIIIEGSDDGETWREYSFPYKPGQLHRGLPWVAPYQPRLDWQMWFAALGSYPESPWFAGLARGLLVGDPAILGLLNPPPFARPPHYLRALLYDYQFTTPAERSRTGAVWRRELKGVWFPASSLRVP